MAKGHINETMTNAHLKVGSNAAIEHKMRELVAKLNNRVAMFTNHIADIEINTTSAPHDPRPLADDAEGTMNVVAESTKARIAAAVDAINAALKYQKMFVLEHNITWKAPKPDVLMNCLIFLALATVEGLTTAMFFLDGGYVSGIAAALGLGLTISSINIVLSGLLGGGFFGKFWNYGIHVREDSSAVHVKRLAGRICSVLTVLATTFVLLISGIVRATGEPEHLSYSFETIGTAASDFHSVLLWILGAAFAILSWRKGLSAFSSSYPGLSETSKTVTKSESLVKSSHEAALVEIDALCEDALNDLDDMAQEVSDEQRNLIHDVQEVQHHREDVLAAISDAQSEFIAFQAEQTSIYLALSDVVETPVHITFDTDAWRSKLPSISIDVCAHASGFAEAHTRARAQITMAKKTALQAVNEAYRSTLN